MDEKVGWQGHFILFDLVDCIFESSVLFHQPVARVLVIVQPSFSILNMLVEPPAHRLDFGIPRVDRAVAVAIVARSFKNRLDGSRDDKGPADVALGQSRGFVLFGAYELNNNQASGQEQQCPFEYFHGPPLKIV